MFDFSCIKSNKKVFMIGSIVKRLYLRYIKLSIGCLLILLTNKILTEILDSNSYSNST
jgi:hypothetical protein